MKTTHLWQDILHEYSNQLRRQDREIEQTGGNYPDGMAMLAKELWLTELPREEVVRRLTEAAAKAGVLDKIHMSRPRADLDGPRLIPEGATNRQIIEMIAQAD